MDSSYWMKLFSTLIILPALLLSTAPAAAADTTRERTQERIETEEVDPAPTQVTEVTREEVRVEEETGNYMLVITRSAFLGGILGGLVGGAGYLISGRDWSPWNIAYFAAGGVLLGAGVGLIEVVMRESRAPAAASLEWMERDMPTTFQIPLFYKGF